MAHFMPRGAGVAPMAATLVPSAGAKDKATFFDGIYSDEQGCKMQRALDAGTPKRVDTVPEVLTEDGFNGWESDCTLTKVFDHEPGQSWIGLMLCSSGPTMEPQMAAFYKVKDGMFEVGYPGQDEATTYVRCSDSKGKTER